MPLLLGNNGIDLFLWNLRILPANHQSIAIYYQLIENVVESLIKFMFAFNLFKSFRLSSSKGIQQRRTYYGSLDDTVITIEADESTPLVVDRPLMADNNNNRGNNNNNNRKINVKNAKWKHGVLSWPHGSDCSEYSSKTFKSHFTEMRVLAFALFLAITLCIAIYLLAIESKFKKPRDI